MTQNKKYGLRVSEAEGSWTAEVTRRMTARKTVVTKAQTGFASEAEATAWGEETLKGIVDNLMLRNERRAKQRVERNEAAAAKEAAAEKWRAERDAAGDSDLDDDFFDEDDE
ncbi:DUF3622 domain-containing protein [Shewanella loihica]|uniref:DUF3622 domain-containing protein n=1 Tax=Shewanella loihica (strain ATCC BAA-1088 / PV-4) TaxID=323850 RepID=A3QAH9_SHELP|nr:MULTISPECIES: DUF3622 domain-containing protein [Shewanella]ABO22477.1 conserved hypothetical protein [Shewanella loihica PV-4]QYJ83022.1 DUF3622 domain-containing protein [Shewanella aegiceratis]